MSERFLVTTDNRVTTSGYELGRIHEHPTMTSTGSVAKQKPSKWFAVADGGILGIHSLRDRAALQVIRESYPDATLIDIDYESEAG